MEEDYPAERIESIKHLLVSIAFPEALKVEILDVTASFHNIWVLSFKNADFLKLLQQHCAALTSYECICMSQLVLRVSGDHIPKLKTDNEVATLNWLAAQTTVPIPQVLYHDATLNNPIGHEYMIMTRSTGVTAGDIYQEITAEKMDRILHQMAEYQLQLYKHPFERLGGLRISEFSGHIVPGPPMNEHYWFTQHIKKHWSAKETYWTLNPASIDGYPTYVSWITAHVNCYIHGIEIHDSMRWLRKYVPRLHAFLASINEPEFAVKLNDVPFRLAHCDLHFSQFLVDPITYQITAVLDWEFASIVPLPLWRRSFLVWLNESIDWSAERERLYSLWVEKVRSLEKGTQMLQDMEWKHKDQEHVWNICNYLRSIGQVCVYGSSAHRARDWMEQISALLNDLEIVVV